MKKKFAAACSFIVTTIAVVTLTLPSAFGQVENPVKEIKTGLPAYIPPPCVGKPISKMSRDEMMAQTFLELKPNPSISPEDQLRMFNDLTGIIQANYLYPDFRGIDWPGIISEFRGKIEKGLETEQFYSAMEEFIQKLGDRHSHFESPVKSEAAIARLTGEKHYVGVGALFQALEETKQVTVLAVIPGSPADHCGLRQHDVVLEVDGIPLVQNNKVYPLTRGPECSMATITFRSPGKETRNVNLIRARFSGAMPVYARLIPAGDERRIGYIFFPTFFDLTVPGQVKKALEDLGPLDGLVLDNRMNGGGSSKVLLPVLSYFTSGTLGHFVGRETRRLLEVTADPVGNSQQVPLVILASKNTVSYAEIFTGILQDIGRARVVGQTTAGRVETLNSFNFNNGSKLWLATERFDPVRSHADWQDRGIRPDAEAPSRWDEFTFENDPALAIALKMLHKQ